ncbi:AraC family transcriptional regulator [Aestuariivirga sp.]|uniref:AraC family transcriptional regulator n=1 Tax=Aestuariivirga sp. TaxID=2650926 RepID=UPI0035AF8F2C
MTTDVLSEVLSAIRLTGSVFFDVEAASPWVAEAPPSAAIAQAVMPGAQHAIEYHVVVSGSCWISLIGGEPFEPVQLREGDIAVIPHGEPHAVSSAPAMRAEPDIEAHRRPADESCLPFKMMTGSDAARDARLLCGFFACDVRPFNPLVGSLPRLLRIGRSSSATADALLGQIITLASEEARETHAGAQGFLNKLSELLFIEAIRCHMQTLDAQDTGWLGGLRDPLVGRAIALMHAAPARAWTLEALAAEAGASRSGLAGRFSQLIGYPPMQYLTRWRMQLAARHLAERGAKVSAVAQLVGYESEAAFSRAFKKFSGQSPSDWRSA